MDGGALAVEVVLGGSPAADEAWLKDQPRPRLLEKTVGVGVGDAGAPCRSGGRQLQ
jgi:hypothetical protein